MPETGSTEELPKSVEEMICFTIYSAGHAFSRAYGPLLKELNLTYPQYITLMVLWDEDGLSVGELCERLRLETSTLTPLLKRLEKLGHVARNRAKDDERQVVVSLTRSGRSLQKHAAGITKCIVDATGYDHKTLNALVGKIAKLRDTMSGS